MARAWYNEIDPYTAQWLRNLIAAGLIAPGDVDERSIEDVRPSELSGYTQCHFFAGIGVWSHALRTAGWPDDRPVWTGSCPCQPFSAAGKRRGTSDERHLFPAWHYLISKRRPDTVFGEQVASKDGLVWFDAVHTEMENAGYAVGAADLCAAGFGAPHIRQRLYFAAERLDDGNGERRFRRRSGEASIRTVELERPCYAGGLVNGLGAGLEGQSWDGRGGTGWTRTPGSASTAGGAGGMADLRSDGWLEGWNGKPASWYDGTIGDGTAGRMVNGERTSPTNGFWEAADWLFCRDGKWRPVRPGTFPLARGASARVGRLRAYGNAIVAPQATAFIRAYMETEQCTL